MKIRQRFLRFPFIQTSVIKEIPVALRSLDPEDAMTSTSSTMFVPWIKYGPVYYFHEVGHAHSGTKTSPEPTRGTIILILINIQIA